MLTAFSHLFLPICGIFAVGGMIAGIAQRVKAASERKRQDAADYEITIDL